jgi:hypothetical protein
MIGRASLCIDGRDAHRADETTVSAPRVVAALGLSSGNGLSIEFPTRVSDCTLSSEK